MTNWTGHILRRNRLLKHVIEGKLRGKYRNEEEGVSSYWMTLRKKKILEIERGSTRSHPVENSLWKRLRTCRKTDCRMIEESTTASQAVGHIGTCWVVLEFRACMRT
jgi:hypothetical protein